MNKNKSVLHYILGVLTGLLFIPVIEELISVIGAWIQVLVLKPTKIVLKGNKEIAELQGDEEEPVQSHLIGFQAPDNYEYYDEEEDDY